MRRARSLRGAGMLEDEQVQFPPLPCDCYASSGHALPDLPPHRRAPARNARSPFPVAIAETPHCPDVPLHSRLPTWHDLPPRLSRSQGSRSVANPWWGCARIAAVISSLDLGVFAVAAAGVLYAFSCVVDALPEQCLRRRPRANPLVAAVFRTKRLLREGCSATCPRRRRPGQARHTQGGLQITADMGDHRLRADQDCRRPELDVLLAG